MNLNTWPREKATQIDSNDTLPSFKAIQDGNGPLKVAQGHMKGNKKQKHLIALGSQNIFKDGTLGGA